MLNQTSAVVHIDFDASDTGGCPDTALTSPTLTGPGYSLTITPSPNESGDELQWTGSGVLTLNTPSSLPSTPVSGFIKPKYMVVGMYYDPPGQKSSVVYTNGFVNGTVTSSSNSYANTESLTVSLTVNVGVEVLDAKATDSYTAAITGQWAQTTTDSQTVTVSQTQTLGYTLPGPSASKDGIDHGEDVVWVWVNPEVSITLVQNIGVTVNGYFFDPTDPLQAMDVVHLTINELQNPALIPQDLMDRINRIWDPAGGPLNSADFADIANTDPYVANASYDPQTDTSGRFTDTGVTVDYTPTDGSGQGQASSQAYNVSTSSLTATTHSQSDSHSNQFTVDETLSGALFGENAKYAFKSSYTYKQTNTSSTTTNKGKNQSATATIFQPLYTDGYTGPTAIKIYRDEVYGTYMFYGAE